MTREQTIEIEQAVRRVLSGILGEAPDELTARGAGEQPPTPAPPGGGQGEIPPAVLTAVKELSRDLSPENAQTLASMFEAMGGEPEEDEEAPEEDQEAGMETYADIELSSEAEAKAEGKRIARARRGSVVSAIIRALRKSGPLFRAAVREAKRGLRAFKKWVDSLSNFNPVKWAIKGLPQTLLYELINWLASQREASQRGEVMTGERTSEIEQAVRRVLSEALTEPR